MAVTNQKPELLLMGAMGLTEADVARRRDIVGLDAHDLLHLARVKDLVVSHVGEYTAAFFDYLTQLEEARPLFVDKPMLARARQLKNQHVLAMVDGDYGIDYVAQRLEMGLLYSQVGLDVRVFLGAYHHLLRTIGFAIMQRPGGGGPDDFQNFMSLNKVAFFDIGLFVDVLVFQGRHAPRRSAPPASGPALIG